MANLFQSIKSTFNKPNLSRFIANASDRYNPFDKQFQQSRPNLQKAVRYLNTPTSSVQNPLNLRVSQNRVNLGNAILGAENYLNTKDVFRNAVVPGVKDATNLGLDLTVRQVAPRILQLANAKDRGQTQKLLGGQGNELINTNDPYLGKFGRGVTQAVLGGPNSGSFFFKENPSTLKGAQEYNKKAAESIGVKGAPASLYGLGATALGLGLDIIPGGSSSDDVIKGIAKAQDARTVTSLLKKAGQNVDQNTIKKLVRETDTNKIKNLLNPTGKVDIKIPSLRIKSDKSIGRTTYKLDEVIHNSKLYEKYPELKNINVHFSRTNSLGNGYSDGNIVLAPFSFDVFDKNGEQVMNILDGTSVRLNEKGLNTIIHELEHAKQIKVKGYQSNIIKDDIAKVLKENLYINDPKEIGARNAEAKYFSQYKNALSQPTVAKETIPEVLRPTGHGVKQLRTEPSKLETGITSNYKKPFVKSQQDLYEDLTRLEVGADKKGSKKYVSDVLNKYFGNIEADKVKTTALLRKNGILDIDPKKTDDIIASAHGIKPAGENAGIVGNIRKIFNDWYVDAKKANPDMGKIDEYFPQIWDQSDNAIKQKMVRNGLSGSFNSANPRTLTYEQGLALGLKPKYNTVAEYMSEYARNLSKSNSQRATFRALLDNGVIVGPDAARLDRNLVPVTGYGFPKATVVVGKGKTIVDNYYTTPEIAKYLNRAFGEAEPTDGFYKTLKTLGNISSFGQEVTLSGGAPKTPFNFMGLALNVKQLTTGHAVTPTKATAVSSIGKRGFSNWLEKGNHLDSLDYIVRNGKNLSTVYNVDNLVKRKKIFEAPLKEIFGDRLPRNWHSMIDDPTFKEMIPAQAILDFEHTVKTLTKNGVPLEQAQKTALDAIDNYHVLGNLSEQAMTNPYWYQFKRAALFAPRYRKAIISFYGNLAKSLKHPLKVENRNNVRFMAGAIASFYMYNEVNKANTGHNMWENPKGKEDKMLIKVGDRYIGVPFLPSIGTTARTAAKVTSSLIKGDTQQAVKDATGLLSQPIQTLNSLSSNEDYFGNKIYNEFDPTSEKLKKQAGYVKRQFSHPYEKGALDYATKEGYVNPELGKYLGAQPDKPNYQIASEVLELPFRFYKAKSIEDAPIWEQYENQKKVIDIQNAIKYGDISEEQGKKQIEKLSGNKIGTGQLLTTTQKGAMVYTDADGMIKFADTQDEANKEIAKSEFRKSNDSFRDMGDYVLRKSDNGEVRTQTKIQYQDDVYYAELGMYKDKGDLKNWMATAEKKVAGMEQMLRDPNTDQLEKIQIQNRINDLKEQAEKYAEYGGFKKPKKGGKSSNRISLSTSGGSSKSASIKKPANIASIALKGGTRGRTVKLQTRKGNKNRELYA